MSELHATKLQRVPAADVTSLVIGHVVGAFSQQLGAFCGGYDSYLAGIDDASDTVRQLMDTNATFAHYVEVMN